MKRKKKILVGCGALAGLAFLTCGGGYLWLRSWLSEAPEPLDGRRLAGPETRVILLYRAGEDDTGARELARHLAKLLEEKGKFPEEARDMIGYLGYDNLPDFAEALLPITMGVLVDKDLGRVEFASFGRHANPIARGIRYDLEKEGETLGEHDGTALFRTDDGCAAVKENTWFFATSQELLETALDRAQDAAPSREGAARHLDPSSPLTLSVEGDGDFLDRFLDQARDEKGVSFGESLRKNLDLTGRDFERCSFAGKVGVESLEGDWLLVPAGASRTPRIARSVDRLLAELVRYYLSEGLDLEHQSRRSGDEIEVHWTLGNLDRFWQDVVAE
ncbi:MAG: hypothetical protein HY720_06955 [Planctomycetes bacterium]|nr:hypothetical protein [Planctomycetota bacterium]